MSEKRPRHYAAEIMALPKEKRKEAFSKVPSEYKDLVMKHCQVIQDKRKGE